MILFPKKKFKERIILFFTMIISKKIFEDLSSIHRQEIYQWISLVGSMEGKLFTSDV